LRKVRGPTRLVRVFEKCRRKLAHLVAHRLGHEQIFPEPSRAVQGQFAGGARASARFNAAIALTAEAA
jgi:hypothetical protein